MDLNPEDLRIDAGLRVAIEAVFASYSEAIREAAKRVDQVRDEDVAQAKAKGLAIMKPLESHDGKAHARVPSAGIPYVMTYEATAPGVLTSVAVRVSDLPRYRYLENLRWYIVREAGAQIVSIYAAIGLTPSVHAEALIQRIVECCEKHMQ